MEAKIDLKIELQSERSVCPKWKAAGVPLIVFVPAVTGIALLTYLAGIWRHLNHSMLAGPRCSWEPQSSPGQAVLQRICSNASLTLLK